MSVYKLTSEKNGLILTLTYMQTSFICEQAAKNLNFTCHHSGLAATTASSNSAASQFLHQAPLVMVDQALVKVNALAPSDTEGPSSTLSSMTTR